ncbi:MULTISPECIES: MarR family transcriptional regulator [unclassified Leptolyngbya]|uniref:MarR family winged helix-turn-helix transcriptional regulator n=1 Tax=unclassified Leptolyngbya TaxID=2650499 RepID=UPI0016842939|nr:MULTISPECIES: MarR family transcriptional regulator [unclassified Leptolyngbya]MBD1911331.1 MarR family transcriptional regulator [Leptolyngbya sp. FACHB-8]MBD2156651.1 MarR family transcriptional regulator [Leptolyngbya sp. FACHB-16]
MEKERDRIDDILEQWHQESPQLDVSSLAVIGRVLRIARLLEKRREQVLADYGLNVWSFDMLATLRRQGPPYQLKPTELYGLLMLSSGAMTNRIDRLEQDGVVVRLRDPGDRRSVSVQLTQKGIDLTDRVMPVLFAKEKQMMEQFSTMEEQTLVQLLRQFLKSFDDQET